LEKPFLLWPEIFEASAHKGLQRCRLNKRKDGENKHKTEKREQAQIFIFFHYTCFTRAGDLES